MRSANKLPAELDLGKKYFTSSKVIKNDFESFSSEILGYFIDQSSAFEFENSLIKENFSNPLILNKHYQESMSTFSMKGVKREDLSLFNKTRKMKKEFRMYTCSHCREDFYIEEFSHHHWKEICFCTRSCRASYFNKKKKILPKKVLKKKQATIPRIAWNKGIPNPKIIGDKTPMKQESNKEKMRKISTGRKRKYHPDGSWTWEYPTTSVSEQVGTISESNCLSSH